jgi:translation initiation factor IF-2
MKTLTELSGTLVRTAAAAIADARRLLPPEPAAEVAAPPPQEAPAEAAGEAPGGEAAPVAAATPAVEGGAGAEPKAGESEATRAALDAAVAKATGLSGDRLGMLRAAVEAVGKRAIDVRLVRVFPAGEPLAGATAIGEHQYLVDYFPASMKQLAGGAPEERGGGRRGGRGPRGGPGRGGGGKGAAATGGFSMDAVREDRRNERGGRGRPGGARRPGGGAGPKK